MSNAHLFFNLKREHLKGELLTRPKAPTASLIKGILVCSLVAVSLSPFLSDASSAKEVYDVVILNGRVIDPESQTDAVRNIGISGRSIKVITGNDLNGREVINAEGLVVSPGFIDLHQHGQDAENYRFKVMDGVTTALELEVGTGDVDSVKGRL